MRWNILKSVLFLKGRKPATTLRPDPILAEIQENRDRLANCKAHGFLTEGRPKNPNGPPNGIFCQRCGGKMTIGEAMAYSSGYYAAGGKATDVFPDQLAKPAKRNH